MEHQRQEPGQVSPLPAARIEDDFIQPLKPMRNVSHRRLPAALPFAIAGLLVFTTVAFGATVAHNFIAAAPAAVSTATANVVGDDGPIESPDQTAAATSTDTLIDTGTSTDSPPATETPTEAPTAAPTKAPTKTAAPTHNLGDLGNLKVKNNGDGTYTFSWAAYKGDKDYDYYKLSGVKSPDKPGYVEHDGQYWDGGCVDPGTTSVTVSVGVGTWNFNIEAVKLGDAAVAVARTHVYKLTVADHTAPPVVALNLSTKVNADGSVDLTWSKYTGSSFQYYGIVRIDGGGTPTLKAGQTPKVYFDSQSKTSYTDDGTGDLGSLVPGNTYSYRVYAYTEAALGDASGVTPACEVGTILGISNVKTVTIPAASGE